VREFQAILCSGCRLQRAPEQFTDSAGDTTTANDSAKFQREEHLLRLERVAAGDPLASSLLFPYHSSTTVAVPIEMLQ
jgi:hypothetical protein